jgi:hypothetical protein
MLIPTIGIAWMFESFLRISGRTSNPFGFFMTFVILLHSHFLDFCNVPQNDMSFVEFSRFIIELLVDASLYTGNMLLSCPKNLNHVLYKINAEPEPEPCRDMSFSLMFKKDESLFLSGVTEIVKKNKRLSSIILEAIICTKKYTSTPPKINIAKKNPNSLLQYISKLSDCFRHF